MPLVRITIPESLRDQGAEIGDSVHWAMVEEIGIPKDDRFQVITAHPAKGLVYDEQFWGVQRSPGFMVIEITLARGRSTEVKQQLYRHIVRNLSTSFEIRPEDVFISLLEVGIDDFSLGNGEAQFVDALPPHLNSLQN